MLVPFRRESQGCRRVPCDDSTAPPAEDSGATNVSVRRRLTTDNHRHCPFSLYCHRIICYNPLVGFRIPPTHSGLHLSGSQPDSCALEVCEELLTVQVPGSGQRRGDADSQEVQLPTCTCSEMPALSTNAWRRPPSPHPVLKVLVFFLPKPCKTRLRPLTHRRAL